VRNDGEELSRREGVFLALGALVFTVVVYLTRPTLFDTLDWTRVHVFYKQYAHDALRAGRLPLWNPHVALGRPFLADVDAALFYPPHLLYALFEIHVACVLVTALHTLLAAVGATLLARALGISRLLSLTIGFLFLASAPQVACFQNGLIHYGAALAYLPVIFYLGVRLQDRTGPAPGPAARLAVALGLQLMCGHPQASWVTGVGLGVFLFVRRLARPLRQTLLWAAGDLGWVGAATLAAIGVAGIQVLPLAELMKLSNRQSASLAFSASYALRPADWATLLLPADGRLLVPSPAQLYPGVLVVIAGVAGLVTLGNRNARALGAMALVGGLIAAGTSTPAFAVLYRVLPGLSLMRLHSRAALLVVFALVLGAGLFLSQRLRRRDLVVALGVTAAALAAAGWFILGWPGFSGGRGPLLVERAVLAASAAGLLCWWWRSGRGGASPALVAALALHAGVDLGLAAARLKALYRAPTVFSSEEPLRAAMAGAGLFGAEGVPPRVSVLPPVARENAGMRDGWSSYDGYAALHLERTWTAIHLGFGVPVPRDQNSYLDFRLARFGPLPSRTMNLVLGFDQAGGRLVRATNPDPRAYLVGAARTVASWQEALDLMAHGADVHQVALVESALDLPPTAGDGPPGTARMQRFEPEAVSVAVEATRAGLLVLAEAYYPGWTATVNGRPAPCLPVNGWMRGVPVPAGASEVKLRFHSTRLAAGAMLSATTAVLLAVVLVIDRRRRRAGPTAAPG
jgi:hypothetical protein